MRLWIVEPDGSGGMIHYAYQMADALSRSGLDVTLVTSTDYELADFPHRFTVRPEMRLWPAVEESRPPWLIRKARRLVRAVRFFREWRVMTRRAIRERPDVVQFAIIRFPLQGWWLRKLRRSGVKLTQVCHEFELREARRPWSALHRRATRRLYGCFDLIFFHGPQTRGEFVASTHYPMEQTHLIRHGNEVEVMRAGDRPGDLRHHYGIAPTQPVALFFGGLRPSKGLDTLIEAFAAVVAELPDARLLIVGHAAASFDLAGLRAHIAGSGVAEAVTLDDRYVPLPEVGRLMRTCDVAVLPYSSGTASGALQVAYAFGRPAVTTEVGDVAGAVDHGVTGLTVPPEQPEMLAAALVKLLGDRAESRRMGDEALHRSTTEFGWNDIAAAVIEATEAIP